MNLGAFSVSLNVKDIAASRKFYESLGFEKVHGDIDQNWLIMKNGSAVIGLFQGMFDKNLLTFNPGWNQDAEELKDYEDIREIQKELKNSGVPLLDECDEKTDGPGSLMLSDPDGNIILVDQHV